MKDIVKLLIERCETISVMESCTGGGLSNCITSIPDASKAFSFGAVTYSNEYKIKLGVNKETIEKYTVYSNEVAMEMAKCISKYTGSTYGVGITGKLKKADDSNLVGADDLVYYSIYNKSNDMFFNGKIKVTYDTREENKKEVINIIVNKILEILNNSK